MSVPSTYFIWNELLVPLWSRSCERQATRRANFSSGVNNFPNSSTCNPKYHIVEKKLTLMPSQAFPFNLWKHVMFIRAQSSFLLNWGCHYLIWNHKMVTRTKKMDNYLENGEHSLSYIKCMPPIVVHHRPVVFLHC